MSVKDTFKYLRIRVVKSKREPRNWQTEVNLNKLYEVRVMSNF